jgi:nicotinamide mononucleotide adenylyltransferase
MPHKDHLTYKTVGIMSGRFQPPHIGHMRAWEWLHTKFDSAFIATSNVVEAFRSPFNFNEKKTMMLQADIPDEAHILLLKLSIRLIQHQPWLFLQSVKKI